MLTPKVITTTDAFLDERDVHRPFNEFLLGRCSLRVRLDQFVWIDLVDDKPGKQFGVEVSRLLRHCLATRNVGNSIFEKGQRVADIGVAKLRPFLRRRPVLLEFAAVFSVAWPDSGAFL